MRCHSRRLFSHVTFMSSAAVRFAIARHFCSHASLDSVARRKRTVSWTHS